MDLAGTYENLIVLRTCSKAVGLAAARLGFAITTPRLTKVLRAVKSPYNVNSISQAMGEVLLKDSCYLKKAAFEMVENRRILEKQLSTLAEEFDEIISVLPSNTNFVFMKCKHSKEIFEALLQRSIAVRCMGDYLRISTGTIKDNQSLMNELTSILQEGF